MGTAERREREKLETRRKIVDAARRLFAEEGYEAVSMRRIADAIEYTPTAIYVHFKDKADLFQDICRCDFLALADRERELAAIADPIERIAALGKTYVRFGVEHPNHYRLMFMTKHAGAASACDLARASNPDEDGYAMLCRSVQEGLAHGRFRPEYTHAGVISQTLWAAVHGVASLAITKGDEDWVGWAPLDERIDVMVDAILAGLTDRPLTTSTRPGRKAKKVGAR